MYCIECGGKNESENSFCVHCGKNLSMSVPCEPAAVDRRPSEPRKAVAIAVGTVMVFFAAVFVLTGHNPATLPGLLFIFVPLMPATVIFLARVEKPVSWIKDFHSWTVRKRDAYDGKSGLLHRWLLRPLIFGLSKAAQLPESTKDPYLRSGIQMSVLLYFIGIMLYVSVSILVVVILLGIALWITYALDRNRGDSAITISGSKRVERKTIQDSVDAKCANCSNYGKQDWSVDLVCYLGRHTPHRGDTPACRSYKERQELLKEYSCTIILPFLLISSLFSVSSHAVSLTLNNAPAEVHFSPNGNCTEAIVKEIDFAKSEILVQAYSFTSAPIAKALVNAHKRQVKIEVIVDKSQKKKGKHTSVTFLVNMGVPAYIDDQHAMVHNNIIVIDGKTVITGSFNFTKAAEEKNAENLIIVKSNELAKVYTDNYAKHREHSEFQQSKPMSNKKAAPKRKA